MGALKGAQLRCSPKGKGVAAAVGPSAEGSQFLDDVDVVQLCLFTAAAGVIPCMLGRFGGTPFEESVAKMDGFPCVARGKGSAGGCQLP